MPKHTPAKRALNRKVKKLRDEGKPRKQAIAQAISTVSKRMRGK